MSSIIASRLPGPRAGRPLALTGRGALESRSRPRAWARRRAGSMVSTQVRRPDSAAHRATAAAVEVLPTPPDPQHTTIRADRASSARGEAATETTAVPAARVAFVPTARVVTGWPLRPPGARHPNPGLPGAPHPNPGLPGARHPNLGMQGPPNGRVADDRMRCSRLSTARPGRAGRPGWPGWPGRPGGRPGRGPPRGRRPRRPGTAARPWAARPARP